MRPLALLVASSACAFLLSACAWTPQSQVDYESAQSSAGHTAILNLTDAQRLRDNVARSEAAIESSGQTLASLATECDRCAQALDYAAEAAAARLRTVGGLWEPWANVSADQQSGLAQLPDVADAPVMPEALAGYMHVTALEQLRELRDIADVDSSERLLISSLLTGRLLSAGYLAGTFGVAADQAGKDLPAGATVTFVGAEAMDTGAKDQDPANPQQSADDADLELLQAAASRYSCVASSLGVSSLTDTNFSLGQSLYDQLLGRRVKLDALTKGAKGPRCLLDFPDESALINELLATDLELVASADQAISELGEEWLLEDVQTALIVGGINPLTPGLQDSTEAEAEASE